MSLKSHKPPPLIWRNIHAASAPAVYGLSAWLVQQLKEVADNLPWLLCSTEEFVSDLCTLRIGSNAKLHRADVKEFFMSGSPEDLHLGTMKWFAKHPKAAVITDVLVWLLREQYVCLGESGADLWRVVRGSGMGLKHSSCIADLAFASAGDVWAVRAGVQRMFKVVYYKSFRDDLIVSERPECMARFFRSYDIVSTRSSKC